MSLDSIDKVYDLNVRTAIQIAQFFSPAMKLAKWGRIIMLAEQFMVLKIVQAMLLQSLL
ncbi:hypothetical protein [Francisella halioticida]|uniref:hypothetical protein n=1 Tax=Francisella halioticida TaxID=549298 RepID=UPI00210126C5|nr:hypothetical protein [Francisella halioticida]